VKVGGEDGKGPDGGNGQGSHGNDLREQMIEVHLADPLSSPVPARRRGRARLLKTPSPKT